MQIIRKKSTKNPIKAPLGKWVSAGVLSPSGTTTLTHQIRLPEGLWAKVRFERVGWGPGQNSKGRDVTGLHPYRPHPTGAAFSDSFTHPITGTGRPIECMLKVYAIEGHAERKQAGEVVTITTSIYKAKQRLGRWTQL